MDEREGTHICNYSTEPTTRPRRLPEKGLVATSWPFHPCPRLTPALSVASHPCASRLPWWWDLWYAVTVPPLPPLGYGAPSLPVSVRQVYIIDYYQTLRL